MASSASPSETELSRSRAGSLLHRICMHPTLFIAYHAPRWELACQRWRPSCHINGACAAVIAGKPAPTGFAFLPHAHCQPPIPVGVSLLAMASSASPSEIELSRSRAGSLLHGICIHPATSLPTADLVGAGLPAMASFPSHQWRLCRRHRWQASSHKDLHPQACCRCTCFYCPCGAGSGSLVTRSKPHNPEVLP